MTGNISNGLAHSGNDVDSPYKLRISRLTIDKLGVKLYDKVSAVVAELVANSYDADAETVTVRLPLGTLLANKGDNGLVVDSGYVIEIQDDGHGMTPQEAVQYYLEIGRDRRKHIEQGGKSRNRKRPVMGRKGIGKLAPFGICRQIEVLSAGGELTEHGYFVTHFYMDYEEIVADDDKPIPLKVGDRDRQYHTKAGTTVRLRYFHSKRVPDSEVLHRQLAARFMLANPDFTVIIEDTRNPTSNPPARVEPVSIPIWEETKIDVSTRPVRTEEGQVLPVSGWLAMARNAYKKEELAGVRIYARNKIVATTRDFEQLAGFTGEFTIRSYLVGEITADWLDLDEGEDLIRTDRQSILWDSDYGRALRDWGANLIREIGAKSHEPRRKKAREQFLQIANIEALARDRFKDKEIADVAIELAKQIGSFAAEDELDNKQYVAGLTEVIFSVAPHRALIEAFQELSKLATGDEISLEKLEDLFGKTQIAEMASYSQIAHERVQAIRELERLVYGTGASEDVFQGLLARAPWLIEPTWTVITKNQALKTFKSGFEHYFEKRTGQKIALAIGYETKRPDFTLVSVGDRLHVVEIKKAGYCLADSDFERLSHYVDAFDAFFAEHDEVKTDFPRGYVIDLVVDCVNLRSYVNEQLFSRWAREDRVKRSSWQDFLTRAKKAHEMFLEVSDRIREWHDGRFNLTQDQN